MREVAVDTNIISDIRKALTPANMSNPFLSEEQQRLYANAREFFYYVLQRKISMIVCPEVFRETYNPQNNFLKNLPISKIILSKYAKSVVFSEKDSIDFEKLVDVLTQQKFPIARNERMEMKIPFENATCEGKKDYIDAKIMARSILMRDSLLTQNLKDFTNQDPFLEGGVGSTVLTQRAAKSLGYDGEVNIFEFESLLNEMKKNSEISQEDQENYQDTPLGWDIWLHENVPQVFNGELVLEEPQFVMFGGVQ